MYEGYHLQNRLQALKALTKQVQVPVARLGVQEGESLNAYAMKAEIVRGKQVAVIPQLARTPFEKAHMDQQGTKVNPADFPNTGYIGEQLGGFE